MTKLLYVIIETFLNKQGYQTKKISSNAISIITNESRVKVLADVSTLLNSEWDKSPSSRSSVGYINVMDTGFKIYAKPEKLQGNGSYGLKNEYVIYNKINEVINKHGSITIQFDYLNGYKQYNNIVGVVQSGTKDTKIGKKSDIELIQMVGSDECIIPISIKKLNAQCWESSDKRCKDLLNQIVNYAMITDQVKLERIGESKKDIFKIDKNLAVKCSNSLAESVIFGSDIKEGGGCIIFQTFSDDDFKYYDGILHIRVHDLVENLSDLNETEFPYILIRNDKTRTSSSIPGVRVLAVTKSRINKRTTVINYEAN